MLPPDPAVLRWAALLVFALTVAALLAHTRRRRRVAARLGDADVLRRLLGGDPGAREPLRLAIVALAAGSLALALLDPAVAAAPRGARGPVVLLLDASGSMLTDDVGARRLDVQRILAADLVDALADQSVGIVVYAGRAYALTPPTRDRGSLQLYLDALDPSIVTQSGSALAAAIRQGVGLVTSGGAGGGSLVLFGDGDDTESADAALDAARLAQRNGVALHVVGIGTRGGGPVPALDLSTGSTEGWIEDAAGEVYLSRLQEELLRSIARAAGGSYADGLEPDAVREIGEAIRGSEEPESTSGALPSYLLLAGAAFLLLLLEPLGGAARTPAGER